MPHQHWIVADDIKLFSVHHHAAGRSPLGSAILLPGLSHSMCDLDYLMSKLARELVSAGFFVAQVDLRGHGDSGGVFSDVTLSSLREDVGIIRRYYRAHGPEPVVCIGRGLSATLLAECAGTEGVTGVAGLIPYCIDPRFLAGAVEGIHAHDGDAFDAFPGNDYVGLSDFSDPTLCMLNALGAVPYNIHGMEISHVLLEQLGAFDPLPALSASALHRTLWLFADESDNAKIKVERFEGRGYVSLEAYRTHPSVVRNPLFQARAITALKNWAVTIACG